MSQSSKTEPCASQKLSNMQVFAERAQNSTDLTDHNQTSSVGTICWRTPDLRGWRSGEGGTTVDTGCTRLEYAGQEENQCISLPVFVALHLWNRSSIRKTVQRGASYHTEVTPKNTKHPNNQALYALIGGPPNYGDGGSGSGCVQLDDVGRAEPGTAVDP